MDREPSQKLCDMWFCVESCGLFALTSFKHIRKYFASYACGFTNLGLLYLG